MQPQSLTTEKTSLAELSSLFLRLGCTSFGGPAAHIALMQSEVVGRKRWMTDEEFLDLISACNLIPGPNSTEMAIHIGHRQAGIPGLILAGLCFIMPSAAIVLGIAWAYTKYAQVPAVGQIMAGIKPIIIAIIAQALLRLTRNALRTDFIKVLALCLFLACFAINNELALLFLAGAVSLVRHWFADRPQIHGGLIFTVLCILILTSMGLLLTQHSFTSAAFPPELNLLNLFLYFAKIGSILYGSGYVLLAFLRADLVSNWHWLTPTQLLDATAVGQVTPGPVFTTATFIGYLLAGTPGAILSTAGIFFPAFLFVGITAPFMARLRKSQIMSAVLDGVNACSLALMAFVCLTLAMDALTQPVFLLEFAAALFVLFRSKVNPTWLIGAGAATGFLFVGH